MQDPTAGAAFRPAFVMPHESAPQRTEREQASKQKSCVKDCFHPLGLTSIDRWCAAAFRRARIAASVCAYLVHASVLHARLGALAGLVVLLAGLPLILILGHRGEMVAAE